MTANFIVKILKQDIQRVLQHKERQHSREVQSCCIVISL